MNNDVQSNASCSLVQFEGELRADHVEALESMWGGEARQVLLDCRRVTRCSEEALAALGAFQRAAEAHGGKVVVVGLTHPALRHVIFLDELPQDGSCAEARPESLPRV